MRNVKGFFAAIVLFSLVLPKTAAFAESFSNVPILDASETSEIRTNLPVDFNTRKPYVPKPSFDPEKVKLFFQRFYPMFFKKAVIIQKPTSESPPPPDAPGNFLGSIGKAVGNGVKTGINAVQQTLSQQNKVNQSK